MLAVDPDGNEAEVLEDVSFKKALLARICTKSAMVGVIGLGYVGLPFAVEKAKVGFQVVGIEQNPRKVQEVNQGRSYISDVSTQDLRVLVEAGRIEACMDYSRVREMDTIVVCVPTPLTKNLTPDLQYIEHVARELAHHMRPGQLICLESTTYPGTTEEVVLPLLQSSGLRVEQEFFLAHSPERVDPGNQRYTTRNTSKVVGGVGSESLEVAVAFYRETVEQVVPVSSAQVAELAKVFENTFRAVNIALVNEMALLCDRMGLSVWEVLDAAFTKPFGIMPFYPGPGIGGHCIPIDPHYLEWKARELDFSTRCIALAGEINRRMPEFVVEKSLRILNSCGIAASQAAVLVLGVAYKRDVADCRESPAIEVIRMLQRWGADVCYHDPLVPSLVDGALHLESQPLTAELIGKADLVVILADHSSVDYVSVVENARRVFDTRNATRNLCHLGEKVTLL